MIYILRSTDFIENTNSLWKIEIPSLILIQTNSQQYVYIELIGWETKKQSNLKALKDPKSPIPWDLNSLILPMTTNFQDLYWLETSVHLFPRSVNNWYSKKIKWIAFTSKLLKVSMSNFWRIALMPLNPWLVRLFLSNFNLKN